MGSLLRFAISSGSSQDNIVDTNVLQDSGYTCICMALQFSFLGLYIPNIGKFVLPHPAVHVVLDHEFFRGQ